MQIHGFTNSAYMNYSTGQAIPFQGSSTKSILNGVSRRWDSNRSSTFTTPRGSANTSRSNSKTTTPATSAYSSYVPTPQQPATPPASTVRTPLSHQQPSTPSNLLQLATSRLGVSPFNSNPSTRASSQVRP